jgi:serine/threonine protein phosphatase 1
MGDLHGNYKALQGVLRKSCIDKRKDTLIFLGDLADGHPGSRECLECLLQFDNFIPLLGNHDLFLKKWALNSVIDERWLKIGGEKTIKQLEGCISDLKIYFEKAKPFHIIEDKIFVHAGFNQNRLIVKQKKLTFSINRALYRLSLAYKKKGIKIKTIYDEADSIKINEIFIGHTPTKGTLPEFNSNLINIDTGAGNTGKLTLMDIYSKKFFQN